MNDALPSFGIKKIIKYQSRIPADDHGKKVMTGEVGSPNLLAYPKYEAKTQPEKEPIFFVR